MPLGTTVTSYIANLFPTDPLAPQVVGDFANTLPPSPIRGEMVSHFAHTLFPTDPVQPGDPYGPAISGYIQILVQPDAGLGDGWIF